MPITDSAPPSDVDTDEVVYVPTSSPPPASQRLLITSAADVYAALGDIRYHDLAKSLGEVDVVARRGRIA